MARDRQEQKAATHPSTKRATLQSGLLTPKEVAEYLNISESQVYTLMRDGDLVALKIGRRGVWRIERDELERYLERLKEEALERIAGTSKSGSTRRAKAARREKSNRKSKPLGD